MSNGMAINIVDVGGCDNATAVTVILMFWVWMLC
jgi:hypothetical protein